MSAYVVDRNHIRFLIDCSMSVARRHRDHSFRWYHDQQMNELNDANAGEVAQMLWDECIASVRYRYNEPPDSTDLPGPIGEDFVYGEHPLWRGDFCPSPVTILKSTDCYEYQSCEHPGWEQSSAHTFIEVLRKQSWRLLEGYEEAKWGAPQYRKQYGEA